jgi:hypothetical protein
MSKRKKLTREFMVAKIMAYDMASILDDAEKGDLSYLTSWLTGGGVTQYDKMSDEDIRKEWIEGEYASKHKHEIVTGSGAYHNQEYIRQLWDTGNADALWDGDGKFHGPNSRKFKTLGRIGGKL